MTRRSSPVRAGPRISALAGLGIVLVALVAGILPGSPTSGAGPALKVSISGSPFRGSAPRSRVTLTATIAEDAHLSVRVLDYDGRVQRTLLDADRPAGDSRITWDGRSQGGRVLPDGAYRLRVVMRDASGATSVDSWVTKAPGVPFAAAPAAIVVAINPGHGGSDPGAVVAGTRESDINLDIALRLRAMLRGAGVSVVMTRTGDTDVNRPALDRNGDHRIDHTDELVARNDVANQARADVVINIHNNATDCRCGEGTEVFLSRKRPWATQNKRLGTRVLARIVRRLRDFQSNAWRVHDRGIGPGDYVALRPATRAAPRPALMPAILGESLYLDRTQERARLRDPRVRGAIAAGYFDGIVGYLADRRYGVRYSQLEIPGRVPVRARVPLHVTIQDTGTGTSLGWRLEARLVPRVPFYDGSGTRGTLIGSRSIPDGLAPGDTADLSVDVTMPRDARSWILKLDVVRGSVRFSDRGVAQAQAVVVTVPAPASATPAPSTTLTSIPGPASTGAPPQNASPVPSTPPAPHASPSASPPVAAASEAPAAEPSEPPEPSQPSPEPSPTTRPAPTPESSRTPTPESSRTPTPEPRPTPTATTTPSAPAEPSPDGPAG